MNVLFLTLLDFSTISEKGIYTDLMREFVKAGNNLYVISPTEKRKKMATCLINNNKTRILKLRIGNIQKTNLIEKGISTITLAPKFKTAINKYFDNVKFDLVLYSTPPVTLQKAVEFVKMRDNAKTYLLLKDIFPQNAVDMGVLKKEGLSRIVFNYFRRKEKQLYKVSDYIGCMSEANVRYVLENNLGVEKNAVEVCPNSLEPSYINMSFEQKLKIREKFKLPKDKTIFIYGGNLGKPQGVDFLIKCISENENNEDSYFLIVGSGTEYKKIKHFFDYEKPSNAKLLDVLPSNEYEILVNSCDVGLIFLDFRFTIPNFPSRLLSYMQASMPVLAATDKYTDIGDIIENGGFGFWCESVDVVTFNKLVKRLKDPTLRSTMGIKSRRYLEKHFSARTSYEIIMRHFR